ncbi:MAG: SoxR reducing system RseC family protein [Porphyromonadaceae bacterium]|nr:SoxR reducing system RseC family protein [Porphyromonadaceae bacterium]
MDKLIEHSGIITQLGEDKIFVRIHQQSACSACHAKSVCMASDKQEKVIVVTSSTENFNIGDAVMLYGKSSTGLLAVLLAFVFPFLLILLCLFVLRNVVADEIVAALISLGILVPYYLILSQFNNKLNKKLQFHLKKVSR